MACCGGREPKETPRVGEIAVKESSAPKDATPIADVSEKISAAKNWFVKSKRFKAMVRKAFDDVDNDKSNTLDTDEIYVAVLLLYLKIAGVCKGAIPPEREKVQELIDKFADPKNKGHLDFDHFEMFCQFLCQQIAGRVAVQMILQMVVAPLLGLLACDIWEKFMMKVAPATYKWCTSKVPAEVVVTLFVGIGVSMFVPPLMQLIDKTILKDAKDAAKEKKKS